MSQIHVNSTDRTADSNSETDFTVKLTGQLRGVKSIRLLSVEVPHAFFNITTNNNRLSITQAAVTVVFIIPAGNYNATTYAASFNALIAGAFPNISLSFDNSTLRYTISDSLSTPFDVNTASTALADIGFDPNVALTGGFTYTAPKATDFNRTKGGQYLYIQSHRLSSVQSAPLSNNDYSSCIFKVPILTGFGSVIDLPASVEQSYNYGDTAKYIDEIDIRLTRPDGTIVDNNGVDWSFSIGVEYF